MIEVIKNLPLAYILSGACAFIGLLILLGMIASGRDKRKLKEKREKIQRLQKLLENETARYRKARDARDTHYREREALKRELAGRAYMLDQQKDTIRQLREAGAATRAHIKTLLARLGAEEPQPLTIASGTAAIYAAVAEMKARAENVAVVTLERDALTAKVAGHERFLMDLSVATAEITKNPIQTLDMGALVRKFEEEHDPDAEIIEPKVERVCAPGESVIEEHLKRVRVGGRGVTLRRSGGVEEIEG